jgi:hypothetical protein
MRVKEEPVLLPAKFTEKVVSSEINICRDEGARSTTAPGGVPEKRDQFSSMD